MISSQRDNLSNRTEMIGLYIHVCSMCQFWVVEHCLSMCAKNTLHLIYSEICCIHFTQNHSKKKGEVGTPLKFYESSVFPMRSMLSWTYQTVKLCCCFTALFHFCCCCSTCLFPLFFEMMLFDLFQLDLNRLPSKFRTVLTQIIYEV